MALKTKYSPFQKLSIENLYTAFTGLAPREKVIALSITGLLLLVFLFLPFSLVSGKISSLQTEVSESQKGYREVVKQIADYKASQERIRQMERKLGSGGSITSVVEGVARQAGIPVDQLKEKPNQETDFLEVKAVEVRLSNVTLPQMMEFIKGIESDSSALMRFQKLQMKPSFKNRQILEVSCEIASYSLRKET